MSLKGETLFITGAYGVGVFVYCRKVEAGFAGEHRGNAKCRTLAGINVEVPHKCAFFGEFGITIPSLASGCAADK